jgi:hypothetical protein
LILSRVVPALRFPLAIVPLVMTTARGAKRGDLVAPRRPAGLCRLIAAVTVVPHVGLLWTAAVS